MKDWEEILKPVIQDAMQALEEGAEFMGGQIPLVVQEYLTYYTVYHSLSILLPSIVIAITLLYYSRWMKKKLEEKTHELKEIIKRLRSQLFDFYLPDKRKINRFLYSIRAGCHIERRNLQRGENTEARIKALKNRIKELDDTMEQLRQQPDAPDTDSGPPEYIERPQPPMTITMRKMDDPVLIHKFG